MEGFLSFVDNYPLVAHNADFDKSFIQAACLECDVEDVENEFVDTLALARKKCPDAASYKLGDLAEYLEVDAGDVMQAHRALADARTTLALFRKLIEL